MEERIVRKIPAIFLLFFNISCNAEWSYEGKNSPEKWGDLKEEYKFCKIGYNQSPIDIKDNFEKSNLEFSYSLLEVEKVKKNYVVEVDFYGFDFVKRLRRKYFLRSLEFHHPSEHLLEGKDHSLEMQILHKSDDQQDLIISVFLELQEEDNFKFDNLINFLSSKKKAGKIDLSEIINKNDKTFFYDGSFTTPPCKEGVKWYVMQTPLKISKGQMNKIIKSAILKTPNSRPVQEFHPSLY